MRTIFSSLMIRHAARLVGIGLVVLANAGLAQAQIVIGQTAGISGVVASSVGEAIEGANLVIDAVNAQGGIHGEKLRIVRLDDGFDPDRASENAKTLIEKHNVLALFMTRGTPHTLGILPIVDQHGVPLIAPSTGAMALHRPPHRWVFNVRTPYQRESEQVARWLSTMGLERVAVVYVNDDFGKDALMGALKGLNVKPMATIAVDRIKPDYAAVVPQLITAQAVIWLGSGTTVVGGVQALRRAGSKAQVITLSNNASNGFIKSLGKDGNGVVVMQVFPNERSRATPLVLEAMQLAGDKPLSPVMLEGVAAAKVLVEALRRAGKNPTRERLRAALEDLKDFNLGGNKLYISYSRQNHTGLTYTDLSIIQQGRFER